MTNKMPTSLLAIFSHHAAYSTPFFCFSFIRANAPKFTHSALVNDGSALTMHTFSPAILIKNLPPDSPSIVALDTFIGNRGRHRRNYFYCAESDHFYLIDLESSFSTPLGMYACNTMQSLPDDTSFTLLPREVLALAVYNNTLKKLISLYTPDSIYEQLTTNITGCNPEFAQKNGIQEESFTINDIPEIISEQDDTLIQSSLETITPRKIKKTLEKQLALYQAMIKQNYESCIQLISLLDELLARYL